MGDPEFVEGSGEEWGGGGASEDRGLPAEEVSSQLLLR